MPGTTSSWDAPFDSRREISRKPLEERVAKKSQAPTSPYVCTRGAVISYLPIVTERRSPNGHALSTSARAMFVNL